MPIVIAVMIGAFALINLVLLAPSYTGNVVSERFSLEAAGVNPMIRSSYADLRTIALSDLNQQAARSHDSDRIATMTQTQTQTQTQTEVPDDDDDDDDDDLDWNNDCILDTCRAACEMLSGEALLQCLEKCDCEALEPPTSCHRMVGVVNYQGDVVCEAIIISGCIPCQHASDCVDSDRYTLDVCAMSRCEFVPYYPCTTADECDDGNENTQDICDPIIHQCRHALIP